MQDSGGKETPPLDSATLVIAQRVLAARSIRGAARELKRAPGSVAAAVARLEAEISVTLVERAGTGMVLTLEAQRLAPDIEKAAAIVAAVLPGSSRKTVSLDALWRFAEVVEAGSVRKAAQRLNLGQPQLTRQLAALEALAGQALLVRGTAGSRPTVEGERVLGLVHELEAVWARLTRAATDRFRKSAATVRLGSVIPLGYESELARLLADLTARWLKARPRQPLLVSSTTAEELLSGLKGGRFDAAILDVEAVPPEYEARLIYRSSLALVGTQAALEPAMDLGMLLASMPIAVPSPKSGLRHAVTHYLDATLGEAQREKLTLIEIDSIPVIVNLILHHGFLSVLPEASVSNIRGDLGRIPLGDEHALSIRLVWPQGGRGLGEMVLGLMDEG